MLLLCASAKVHSCASFLFNPSPSNVVYRLHVMLRLDDGHSRCYSSSVLLCSVVCVCACVRVPIAMLQLKCSSGNPSYEAGG